MNLRIKLLMIVTLTTLISLLVYNFGGEVNSLSIAIAWIGGTIFTREVYK